MVIFEKFINKNINLKKLKLETTSISSIVAVNPVFLAGGRMMAYLQSKGEKGVAKV